ncbi:rhodanese-like domain-containing protein [Geobacter sulfurreducens]|uniref:rhodanese-like domain-containing protein n=1 Tax=Geobacter sulfurreducens TaxID=35554 RepID=UPI000DBB82AE|nr:rhodanese-like domain-containing protein [Geobacter sulfurreducens]BBA70946.1 Thiosulfate sulfurtransferase [Geobacter sulfurreducens]
MSHSPWSAGDVATRCTACGICVAECAFLREHGTPQALAASFDPRRQDQSHLPFGCSLCGLCRAVCPEGVDPAALFLAMRRATADAGTLQLSPYRGLLSYERAGTSRLFTWYGLPDGCRTIFFPGCALPGTRPRTTLKLFDLLRGSEPSLGMVLDCCTKPSHDLGRSRHFTAMFGEMKAYLLAQGVKTVQVACPNCHEVFSRYAPELEVVTVYEVLARAGIRFKQTEGAVTVHDPCVSRDNAGVHAAVRTLLGAAGLRVREMPHHGVRTLCCGEGGAVRCTAPRLAGAWTSLRAAEAGGSTTITYCAGCASYLGPHTPTSHVADLLFEPEAALAGRVKVASGPRTYLNRLLLKRRLRRSLPVASSRERTFRGAADGVGSAVGGRRAAALIFLMLAAAVLVVMLAVSGASARDFGLMEPQTLARAPGTWVVLDGRPRSDWQAGHIPGARSFSWENYTRTDDKGVPYKLWPPRDLARALGAMGIDERTPVVVYGDADKSWGGEGWAAWVLSWLGHKGPVRMLNGGIQAWTAAGLPLTRGHERYSGGTLTYRSAVRPEEDITTAELERSLGTVAIIDTRSFFERLAGRIPGSVHIPWDKFFTGKERRPLAPAEVRRLLARNGVDASRPVVYYCAGGIRSAYALMVHELAGLGPARNYEGGMEEWKRLHR